MLLFFYGQIRYRLFLIGKEIKFVSPNKQFKPVNRLFIQIKI